MEVSEQSLMFSSCRLKKIDFSVFKFLFNGGDRETNDSEFNLGSLKDISPWVSLSFEKWQFWEAVKELFS